MQQIDLNSKWKVHDKAAETFAGDGGRGLISKSLFDCHGPGSQAKIRDMMERQVANASSTTSA